MAGGLTLFIYLRHFGCIGCAEQIGELRPRLHELQALGVRVVLVGTGTPGMRDAFVARERLQGLEVVTDPTLASHRDAGLERSFWGTFGPGAVAGFLSAFARGYRWTGRTEGDLLQQGGAQLKDAGNNVLLSFKSTRIGDNAPLSDFVDRVLVTVASRAEVLV